MTPATTTLVLPSSDRFGTGRYSLVVEVGKPLDVGAIEALRRIAALMTEAGLRGAFPAPGHSPGLSRMTIAYARQEEYRLLFLSDGEGFDLYAFELFRNMIHRLLRQAIEVREIRLSDLQRPLIAPYRKPEPNDQNEYDAYPSPAHVRFAVEAEAFNPTKMRRCLVELAVPVEAFHLLQVQQWITPWFDLIEAGAYALPVAHAAQVDSLRGDVELFDEQSIELTINRFQASETAWGTLVNMLDTCWGDTTLISRLMIE